ncbi:MAG: PEGA domain-containing protein [Patescibacteria group bacterium]
MEGEIQNNPEEQAGLPPDLRMPASAPRITPTPTSPAPKGPISFTPTTLSNEPAVPVISREIEPPPQRRGGSNWVGWLWGILAVLMIGATVYFVLSQIGFNQGKIKFTFDPEGVNVVLDQKLTKTGINSLTISLKAGEHLVQVNKEGYLDFEQSFSLNARETAEMQITLDPVPNMELVSEAAMAFPQLVRRDQLMGFWNASTSTFKAVDLATKTITDLFNAKAIPNLQKAVWSPNGIAIITKLSDIWRLTNMYDNRKVKGQYIPLGDTPEQGPTMDNGVGTWLFDSERTTTAGLQPVLLNENIRDVAFSPDGTQIIYFYEAANGEKSLIRADNIDGGSWVRLTSDVDANNPELIWLQDERWVLLLDDSGQPDKLFDAFSKDFTAVMPDRVAGSLVVGSPDGSHILYLANTTEGTKLTVWNISNQAVETVFPQVATAFVWQADDTAIVAASDGNLWYWGMDGQQKPVKFTNAFGALVPQRLLYSQLLQQLFIFDGSRLFSIKA